MKKKWPIILAILVVSVVAIVYPALLILALILAFIGSIPYLAWRMNKKEKELAAQKEAEQKAEEVARLKAKAEKEAAQKAEEEARRQAAAEREAARKVEEAAREQERQEKAAALEKERIEKVQRFNAELEAIPQVTLERSAPAPRQYLKDMPDFDYANITKTTKLSSIFPLVFLDVETTGLYPVQNEIVEIAAIKFDAGMNPTECFSTLCKPKKPIPQEITKINGITDDMVEDKPNFHEIAPALSQFLKGCNLAGHNLIFDVEFLHVHGTELPFDKKFYDTLELAQRTIKKSYIWNHRLDTVCKWYGIHRDKSHRALSDCYATSKIFTQLVFNKTSRMLDDGANIVSESDH